MSTFFILVDTYKFGFVLLSKFFIVELHLDETKATTSSSLLVSHDNGISNDTILLEELNQVRF